MNIGIFGGSFNPIHIGHLIAAEEVFQQRGLSKVVFIPTGISPHKESGILIDPVHRYEMVRQAISDNEHFEVSDLEIQRVGKSYTIDTIINFKNRKMCKEGDSLYLIMGADMINEINTWKDVKTLSGICHFIVVNRPSVPINEGLDLECILGTEKKVEVERLKVSIPPIGISSTEIRERLQSGRSIRYLVPKCVENYIRTNNLYKG